MMQGIYSPKNSTFNEEQLLSSARSGYRELSQCDDQRQQDLQLLIRAHERIRQIDEQNSHLKQENEKLVNQYKTENAKTQKLEKENFILQQVNQQLLSRIIQLQKKLNGSSLDQSICQDLQKVKETVENTRRKSNFDNQNVEHRFNIEIQNQQGGKKDGSQKVLKQSESTPVILNINVNPFSKEERQSFLNSCKKEFAQELCKITVEENPKRSMTRNKSEYFVLNQTTNKTSQLRLSKNNFLKEAQQEFLDQNSKTKKNISVADRKKSASSTAGSLIKKNFIGQRYSQQGERKIFGQRTNVWNSKYASIDEILRGSKGQTYNNSQSGLKLHPSPSEHIANFRKEERESFKVKNGNKSIYFKTDFSKSMYSGKDRPDEILKEFKKKEIQLELRNQQASGIIKYRGLCL